MNKKLQNIPDIIPTENLKKRELKAIRKSKKYNLDWKVKLPWLCEGKWVTNDDSFQVCTTFLESVKEKIIKKSKWIKIINDPNSPISKLIDDRWTYFFKYNKWLRYYVSFFMGEHNQLYKSLDAKKLPMSKIEIAAIILQNLKFKNNSLKKEAIEKKWIYWYFQWRFSIKIHK